MPSFCGTCKAPILWAMTPTGGNAPVDFEPVEGGNVLLLSPSQFDLLAVTLSGDALKHARERGVGLRLNHWASCPDRVEWRERTDAKRAGAAAS